MMRILPLLFLISTISPLGPQGLADSVRNEQIPNIIDENCEHASELSIRVVNMNGKCEAYWKCDDTSLEVKCEYGQCECRPDSTSATPTKISYDECDSDKLKSCFNRPR